MRPVTRIGRKAETDSRPFRRHLLLVTGATLFSFLIHAAPLPSNQNDRWELRTDDYADTEHVLRQAIGISPNDVQAHYVLARVLAKEGKFREASVELATACRLDPKLTFADPSRIAAFNRDLSAMLAK